MYAIYHTIQKIAEKMVTRMIATIFFLSLAVSGADSAAAFFSADTNSRWSFLKGFLPASPSALPFRMNHAASMNKKIAQIRNTVLKLHLIPNRPVVASMAIKVVPMKEPMLTKEY